MKGAHRNILGALTPDFRSILAGERSVEASEQWTRAREKPALRLTPPTLQPQEVAAVPTQINEHKRSIRANKR